MARDADEDEDDADFDEDPDESDQDPDEAHDVYDDEADDDDASRRVPTLVWIGFVLAALCVLTWVLL